MTGRAGKAAGALAALAVAAVVGLPLLCFLVLAVSPRLFDQGSAWLTVGPLRAALSGEALVALWHTAAVGVGAGILAVLLGGLLAWSIERLAPYGRSLWRALVFVLLLTPSYLLALGVERLVEVGGVLEGAGLPAATARSLAFGPFGLIALLGLKGAPFAYLAVGATLPAAGSRLLEAARVHGGGPLRCARVLVGALAPALWAAFAVAFAETIGDFGIAYTLAAPAHFELSTFYLYAAVDREPIQFPLAAAVGLTLVGLCAVAVILQRRALGNRGFALLRGGFSPPPPPSRRARLGATVLLALYFGLALGVPAFATVTASLLRSLGTATRSFALTLANYRIALAQRPFWSSLAYSALLALCCATAAVALGAAIARLAQGSRGRLAAALEQLTLAALGVPAIVLAAGFILFWNLPILHRLHIALYGTTALLGIGYLAGSLPPAIRLINPALRSIQRSLFDAAAIHGGGRWRSVGLPLLSRPLLYTWLWSFVGILLELPLSSLLYPPGRYPLAIAINRRLEAYEFSVGTAMEVVAICLCGLALALFRRLAPAGLRATGVAG